MIPEIESIQVEKPVLVIGDLMLDEYHYGDVERVSPEAPVPVVRSQQHERRVGGAGSVVANLSALGVSTHVIGLIGNDEAGEHIREALASLGADVSDIVVSKDRPTSCKTRILAGVQHAGRGQQQILRLDREQVQPLSESEFSACRQALKRILDQPLSIILVSDYEKGLLGEELLQELLNEARARGIPVLVDPGRSGEWQKYRGATLICPNRYEASAASGMEVGDEVADHARVGEALVEKLHLEHCILTLDRDGITRVSKGGGLRRHPTRIQAVTDVAGAGDMVLSLLGLSLASGWSMDDACQLANLGAGLEIQKVGVQPVELWELSSARDAYCGLQKDPGHSIEEMVLIMDQYRSSQQTVVFTNGCFDLLHSGHLQLLEAARAFGDALIVGLNSDASVTRLKGPERPILPATERARLLGALSNVDHVVIFDEDTPESLIGQLLPDVLVKGADYSIEEVVGREVVEAAGGRVETVTLKPGFSTSGLIEQIRSGTRSCPETPEG
ncbi:D-glycero-beta-D-manno-heptose 1-phosphate adenylyltransferase [bacterium TMED181]|nr:D-glycero-beta-D-manno-heptose 1-phosphate adenylyltransferase [Planctomycetota bacterium]OUW46155.1 MAG: D-glycero-beta-D-manno-heptose 1-phosphate adenylyltransferase [bacterium TMED181]